MYFINLAKGKLLALPSRISKSIFRLGLSFPVLFQISKQSWEEVFILDMNCTSSFKFTLRNIPQNRFLNLS